MLWKHCHRGTAESINRKRWPVGRKDPKGDILVFNGMLRELKVDWVSIWWTQCFNLFLKVNVIVWHSRVGKYSSQKIFWVFCQEWEGEAETQSKKWHMWCYRHCCLVSWKRWLRVSRFAWHHPLFMRMWNVEGKYGADIWMPRPGCITPSYFVLHSCILPLFPCKVNKKSYWRWRHYFMISYCWE